jgi:hypothetical protein
MSARSLSRHESRVVLAARQDDRPRRRSGGEAPPRHFTPPGRLLKTGPAQVTATAREIRMLAFARHALAGCQEAAPRMPLSPRSPPSPGWRAGLPPRHRLHAAPVHGHRPRRRADRPRRRCAGVPGGGRRLRAAAPRAARERPGADGARGARHLRLHRRARGGRELRRGAARGGAPAAERRRPAPALPGEDGGRAPHWNSARLTLLCLLCGRSIPAAAGHASRQARR